MKKVDLHIHSSCSDGDYNPTEIINLAKRKDLKCISLTDHNTTAGVLEAVNAGKRKNIEVIPGVEICCDCSEVIGYYIDIKNKKLQKLLLKIRKEGDKKAKKTIIKLNEAGYNVKYGEVRRFVRHLLLPKNALKYIVKDKKGKEREELMQKLVKMVYLNDGIAFVNSKLEKAEEVIEIIRQAGGVSVLAHPWVQKDVMKRLPSLLEAGLKGTEIECPFWDKKPVTKKIIKFAKKHDLIQTGGSDFHTDSHPGTRIGKYGCDYRVVEELREGCKKVK
ncbi:MAG: PHP domain-containing protein [Candidatus Pacearchaeota archaeon]|nr:PHP domain-containing protein [Candidatus Pacearchaeota archaeon]